MTPEMDNKGFILYRLPHKIVSHPAVERVRDILKEVKYLEYHKNNIADTHLVPSRYRSQKYSEEIVTSMQKYIRRAI